MSDDGKPADVAADMRWMLQTFETVFLALAGVQTIRLLFALGDIPPWWGAVHIFGICFWTYLAWSARVRRLRYAGLSVTFVFPGIQIWRDGK